MPSSVMSTRLLAWAGTALLVSIFGALHADPVTPDPADCFFYQVPTTVEQGFAGTADLVALSGDGKTALLTASAQLESPEGTRSITDQFIIRDRLRTLLTHYESLNPRDGSPFSDTGTNWYSVGLSFDGASVPTQKRVGDLFQATVLALPGPTELPCPQMEVLGVSGDGRWVVGLSDYPAHPTADTHLVRTRVADGFTEGLPDNTYGSAIVILFGISDTGDRVCGTFLVYLWGYQELHPFLWTPAAGFTYLESVPGFPSNFSVRGMDRSGEVAVGWISTNKGSETVVLPACWTQQAGLVMLPTVLNGADVGSGEATLISGNGEFIFGDLGGSPVVWTRDGSIYPLGALIRGVDFGGVTPATVTRASFEGRTIGGQLLGSLVGSAGRYLAGLALPGEGPRVSLGRNAGGGRSLSFHAKSAFRYQVQTSSDMRAWAGVGAELAGDDADHAVSLPSGSSGGAFFRVVVNP